MLRKARGINHQGILPALDFAKRGVLNTLGLPESTRASAFAIDDFIQWYCSEPRLAFNRPVLLRYRLELEARHLAASTINVRLVDAEDIR